MLVGAAASLLIRWTAGSLLESEPVRVFLYDYGVLRLAVGWGALLAAHLLGGFLAGRASPLSPGLNGVMTVVLAALFGAVRFLVDVLPLVLDPTIDPQVRSENGGLFAFQAMAFAVFLPFALLSGYLGGVLGGLLRRTSGGGGQVVS